MGEGSPRAERTSESQNQLGYVARKLWPVWLRGPSGLGCICTRVEVLLKTCGAKCPPLLLTFCQCSSDISPTLAMVSP